MILFQNSANIHIRTYIHICFHTHTYIHSFMHTFISYIFADIHTYTHIRTYMDIHTYTHIRTYIHVRMTARESI